MIKCRCLRYEGRKIRFAGFLYALLCCLKWIVIKSIIIKAIFINDYEKCLIMAVHPSSKNFVHLQMRLLNF